MDREDGEMSDENAMDVDDAKEEASIDAEQECTVLYKADKNGIFVEKLEKVDASKLEDRAKRFGLNLTGNRVITQRQIDELYSNFGIKSGNERHFRFDAINLNGVDGLTTREIFQYLEDYKPLSLEWIDDITCNVVCQDHISAALALLVHSREIRDENIKKMLSEKSDQHWREGMPHPKKDLILMRFATNADKKITKKKPKQECNNHDEYYDQSMESISKNPWGDLCKSWGVYDHQEVFQRKPLYNQEDDVEELEKPIKIKNKTLAMRLGKRRINDENRIIEKSDDSSDSDSEWKIKSKTPRMRMHADDEESKQKKKQILQYSKDLDTDDYAPLSIEVENSQRKHTQRTSIKLSDKFKIHSSQKHKHSIQSRLGKKVIPIQEKTYDELSDDSSSEHSDSNVTSRVHKVNSTIKSTNSVWSRLDKKPSKSSVGSDLRQKLKSRMQKAPDDIRGKIQKTPDDLRDRMQKIPDDLRDRMQKIPDDLRDRLSKSKQANLRIEIDNNYAQDL